MRTRILLVSCALPVTSITLAQSYGELDVNDVRARFYANGRISMDLGTSMPNFEVPIGGGAHTMFSAGLWIGGYDAGSNLKLAAVLHAQSGNDWYTGPLTTSGAASVDAATMLQYDHVWTVNTAEVELHRAYCDCLADPGCDPAVQFPGYSVPASFFDWPAHGDIGMDQALYLAPFSDFNGDGYYDPADCDAPCAPGDQSLYFIFNDKGNTHTESGGQPIGVEVQARPFAFNGPTAALSNTVFVEYRIINRGTQTLDDTYLGLFTDFDLGCPTDDRIGCDVARSLWYVYNGDSNDQDCLGLQGYGTTPPAFGATILCGAYADYDGLDQMADSALGAFNGVGTGDGDLDNERFGLTHHSYWDQATGPTGFPTTASHFYNYMRGIWTNAVPQMYGGTGYLSSSTQARFAFPDDTDPLGLGTNGIPQPAWSEVSAGNSPGERLSVGSMGPFTLEPGAINRVVVAFVYARSNAGGAMNSVAELQARVDSIRSFAYANDLCGGSREDVPCYDNVNTGVAVEEISAEAPLIIQPSLTSDRITVHLPTHLLGAELEVIDATGRRVMRTEARNGASVHMDVTGLAGGSYTITASRNGARTIGRFVRE